MDTSIPSISPQQLLALRKQDPATLVIDVRREPVFRKAPDRMTGAILRVQVGGVLAEIDANKGNVFHDGLR